MSITSNIANVASRLTTGDVVSNLNADLLDGQSGSYYTGISSSGFDQANTAATIAQAAFVQANNAYAAANNITPQLAPSFGRANSAYDQANSGVIQAQAAFGQANTAYSQANTGTTQAQAAFVQANNAYTQANTKFNTSGGNITGPVTISSSLTVTGNVTFSGNVTTINANNLAIEDNMIYLNNGSIVANPDLGFVGNYNDGTYHHTGFFRDASDGVWKVFDNYKPEPDASPYIDTSNNTFRIADFQANNITANTFSGTAYNSSNLSGNPSSYFTDLSNTATIQTQAAFVQANTGTTQAQAAFLQSNNSYSQANTGTLQAQSAFVQANTGTIQAQSAYIQANSATTQAQAAFLQANNAYAAANNIAPQLGPSFSRANAAYDQANTGTLQAQAAFTQANTGTTQAQAAFLQANTGTNQAQSSYIQANTGTLQAQAAFTQANNAFTQANTGSTVAFASFNQANNAYAQANTGTTQAQAAFSQANNAYAQANTGSTQAQAAFSQANTGSTVAFASFNQANNAYAQANTGSTVAFASFNQANNAYAQANTGTTQAQAAFSQANTGTTQAQAAFSQANNAYAQANTGSTQAQAAFSTANGAYSTANTKFNTSGGNITGPVTISSTLTVTGNVTFSGNVTTVNANNLAIEDNMIYLNNGSTVANPDLGFAGNYNDGTYHHAGFFRDATDGVWKIFDNYKPEPDASIYIDTSNSTFRIASFQANNITANSIILGTDFKLPVGNTAQRPSASAGKLYYNNETGKFEGYGTVWGSIGGGALISDTAPANPASGDLWWNSSDGKTYIYYGNVWVQAQPGGEGQYLPLTGGTVTGSITGTGNFTANNIIASNNITYSGTLTGGTGTYSGTVTANNIVSSNNVTYSGTLTGGTGIVNIGSGQIYKDANGSIGIGTTSPSGKLHVYGGNAIIQTGTGNNIVIQSSAFSGGPGILFNATNDAFNASANLEFNGTALVFGTANAERMRLNSSGNLGLGVTPSAWSGVVALQLPDYGNITSKATRLWIGTNYYYSGGEKYAGTGLATRYRQTDGYHIWDTATSNTAGNPVTFTQVMTLDSSGNLGLGITPSGSYKLEVSGTGKFTSYLSLNDQGYIRGGTNTLDLQAGTSGIRFMNSSYATAQMTIDSSGNLGIATTSPAYKLDVTGTLRGTTSLIAGSSTTNVTINSGAVNFNGANVAFGIIKTAPSVSNTSRFDCSVGALSSNLSGSFWNGWHWAPHDVLTNSSSSNCFPRVGQYWAYGTTANPSDLVFNYYAANLGGIIGNLNFATENAGYVAFGTNSAERLRIDGSGLVGIGTTSPGYALEVHKQILIKGNDSSGNEYQDWPNCSFNIRRSDNYAVNGITMASFGYRSDPIYLTDSAVCNIRIWDSTQAASATTSASTTKMTIGSPGSFSILTGNSADRFVIDSSGRITMPSQPAFITVAVAGGTTYTAGVKINYSVNALNRGSCWNGTNNYFVAPVAGVYLFKAQLWTNTGAAGNAWFYVNGTNRYGSFGNEATNIGYNGYCLTEIFNLAANDTVQVYCRSGTVYTDGSFSTFSGFLIG